MTLREAERIVKLYGAALARGTEGGFARRRSWLPASSEIIVCATKLFLAELIKSQSFPRPISDQLINAISLLPGFVEDSLAERFGTVDKRMGAGQPIAPVASQEMSQFMNEFIEQSFAIRQQVDQFIYEVQKLNPDEPLFYKRVYALARIETPPEKRVSFWDRIWPR